MCDALCARACPAFGYGTRMCRERPGKDSVNDGFGTAVKQKAEETSKEKEPPMRACESGEGGEPGKEGSPPQTPADLAIGVLQFSFRTRGSSSGVTSKSCKNEKR